MASSHDVLKAVKNPKHGYNYLRVRVSGWKPIMDSKWTAMGLVTKIEFEDFFREIAANNDLDRMWEEIHMFDRKASSINPKGRAGYLRRDICAILYCVIRKMKPSKVVETGVASGASTAYLLKALQMNGDGNLYSVDLPTHMSKARRNSSPIPDDKETGWAIPATLIGRWHLVLGDASTELPKLLNELGDIDVFHHDSTHRYEHQKLEYETAWAHLSKAGLLMSDDIGAAYYEFIRMDKKLTHWEYFARWGAVRKS
jgi:predicted O-methyltransferase YrrM